MTESIPKKKPQRSFPEWLAAMPRWKKVMLGSSIACALVGGLLLAINQPDAATTVSAGGGHGPTGGATFLPTGTGGGTTGTGAGGATAAGDEPAAKGVFRLGLSFLVGFCMGSFVRAAVKMASIAVGFFLVALFLLDYAGFVVVDWNAIDQAWNGFWQNVGNEWGDFQRFFTGRLPAAGLASLGLYAGFKRH